MAIKDKIKERRSELNLTLEDVAKKIGVSRQTIQKYETGVITNIPSDKIELLADALSTTPSYLMGWDDIYPKKTTLDSVVNTYEYGDLEAKLADYPYVLNVLPSLCKLTRIENELTEKYVSAQAGIPLDRYVNFEENKINLPINELKDIFKILDINDMTLSGFIVGVVVSSNPDYKKDLIDSYSHQYPNLGEIMEEVLNFDNEELQQLSSHIKTIINQ